MKPEDLLFTKTHEWVHLTTNPTGETIATVGISAFALEALTDLVFIELPPVGRRVEAGGAFGEIESVKAVSDLYSPVNGEVVEVNTAVADRLDRIAEDPYGANWLVKIKVAGDVDRSTLLSSDEYQKQCAEESH